MSSEVLSDKAIQELLDSKEKLTEFSTTALIHAITAGVVRVQDHKTSPSAVSQFIESLRKVRADLTGDNHEATMPQMMVNIQFGQSAAVQPVEIDVTSKASAPQKKLSALDDELLCATSAIFEEANLFEHEE